MENKSSKVILLMIKIIGILLVLISTVFGLFLARLFTAQFECNSADFTYEYCGTLMDLATFYLAIAGFALMSFLICY
jgi:hypothetical protein